MKKIKGVLLFIFVWVGGNLSGQEISINTTDACYNSNTGSMNIDFNQYSEDYTLPFLGNYYNITTGDYEEITVESNPLILSNLPAGEYEFQIFISDDEIMEFCWEVYEYKISEEIVIDTYNADCYDDNGRIVINTSQSLLSYGTPIVASVFNESGVFITEKNIFTGLTLIKNLLGGNYSLRIDLPNGCEEFIPFKIDENQLKIPYEILSITKSCQQDGGIDIYLDPLNGPYNIHWQNMDTGQFFYSEDLQNVSNGTYCLIVQKIGSKNNCEYSDTCLVIESTLSFRDNIVNHVCDSLSTVGSISIVSKFNTYSYKWDTNPTQTTPLLENLGPGKYCVTVTDIDDCEHHECFTVEVLPDSIEISYDLVGVCPKMTDGVISLNINPSTDNTIIIWDDIPDEAQNLVTRSNLSAGDYVVTVTNECATSQQNISLEYDCSCLSWLDFVPSYKLKSDCKDDSGDGYIQFLQTGGLSFLWSTGAVNPSISDLVLGNYKVTITHEVSQCNKVLSFDIEEEETAEVNISIMDNACPSGGNGQLTASISGSYHTFYWEDLGYGSNDFERFDLDAGEYTLILKDACGTHHYGIDLPEYYAALAINEYVGCDPYEEITFDIVGDNPPFDLNWETGDIGSLNSVAPGEYECTITDSKGCEYIDEVIILKEIEIISQVNPCPGVNNGSITFLINNPNNDFMQVTYDFGPCDECEDFPLIDPTLDSVLIISMHNLPGGVPLTFEIDFGDCRITKTFQLGEQIWDKVFTTSEEIDGIIYCTYDKVCGDIIIENGIVEPATIDHWSHQNNDEGWTWQGFGDCGETNLTCGTDSVGIIAGNPIKMRAIEAVAFYYKLGIEFNEFWEIELNKNPCRYTWVCPNGYVYPSFYSGNFFGGGTFTGVSTEGLEEGCQEFKCKYDFGLFSISDNIVICDSFEFLPEWIEPYVNGSGEENEEKCDDPITYDAFSAINLYRNHQNIVEFILEGTELLDFIIDNIDNPAQNCATVTFCKDDYSILYTDINDIECDIEILEPLGILDENGNSIFAEPCKIYKLDENNNFSLCPTNCGPKSEEILGCWYINVVPFEIDLPGITDPNGGPKSQNRNVVMQPQYEITSFYTFTQYVTEYGDLIYKPLFKTDEGNVRLNLLSQDSYETFPLDDIIFSHEDFRNGFHFTISGKEGNYLITSGHFSDVASRLFESSDYLKILSHSFIDGYANITGEFRGDLYVNNQAILGFSNKTHFRLKLDENLNIIDLDYSEETAAIILHSNGKFIEIGDVGGNTLLTLKKDIGIDVLQYHYDPKSNTEYLIVKGIGQIVLNSSNVSLQNDKSLTILCIQNENIVWTKEIGEFGEFFNEIPIAISENQDILIGLSFKNQLEVESLLLTETNQNSFDNIILKFSKSGDIDAYQIISNKSDEFIKEMRVVNNNEVVIGITAKGHEFTREFGEKVFYQFDNLESRGITSYIKIDNMTPFVHNRRQNIDDESFFIINPNPSSERIIIQSIESKHLIEQIQIFDINGMLVYSDYATQAYSKTIDVTALNSGVYTAKITNNNNEIFTNTLNPQAKTKKNREA